MKRFSRLLLFGVAFCGVFYSTSVWAELDQFLGDTIIYSGEVSAPPPNVLFIIDNSSDMNNTAAGEAYDLGWDEVDGCVSCTPYETGSFEPWTVYKVTGQSNYVAHIRNESYDELVASISCETARESLLKYGNYAGSDGADLKSDGTCGNGGAGITYLGSLLNYNESPPEGTGATQIELVRDAIINATGGKQGKVNFGIMEFGHNNKGGQIRFPVSDLSDATAWTEFQTGLEELVEYVRLTPGNSRPLAEVLFDARFYFDKDRTSSQTIISNTSLPDSPVEYFCQKNYVIVVTNGDTEGDSDGNVCIGLSGSTGGGGDYDNDGNTGDRCESHAYGNGTHLMDDVAKYAFDKDLSDDEAEGGLPGMQNLITNTLLIFSPHKDLLEAAAADGEGEYAQAVDANELSEAIGEMLDGIVLETSSAFVAPVVPTSPENRTYSGSRLYLGFFYPKSQEAWFGNLKKFGLSSDMEVIDKDDNLATCPDSENPGECTDLAAGDIKDVAKSYWNDMTDGGEVQIGGAGEVLYGRDFSTDARIIVTNRNTTENLMHDSNKFNATNISAADLGLTADADRDDLINYVYGYDAYAPDADTNSDGIPDNQAKREWILGDILHSRPLIVNYNSYTFNKTNEADSSVNKAMIFVGANDGMLHAFRDSDGKEMWAFIPDNLLLNLKELPDVNHSYFVDSDPVAYVYDKDRDGNIGNSEADDGDSDDGSADKVILLFGQRRGGSAYYALDVTEPLAPKYLWKIDSTVFSELGQSWSVPNLGKVRVTSGSGAVTKVVAFVGAGYDNANEDRRFGETQYFTGNVTDDPEDSTGDVTSSGTATTGVSPKGRGVFAFEVATLSSSGEPTIATSANIVWEFTPSTTNAIHADDIYSRGLLNYSFPSDVTVLDTDYDGYVDRLYVGDTGGRMWRFSAHEYTEDKRPYADSNIGNWFGKIIFSANTGDSDVGRKLFYRPSVTYESDFIALYFGSGDRPHPLNQAVTDRMYAVFDRGQEASKAESDLVDVTTDLLQDSSASVTDISTILDSLFANDNYGWYIRLNENSGEKILAPGLAFNKVVYYTSYAPNIVVSTEPCNVGNLGISRLYAVDYLTGEAVLNFYSGNDSESTSDNKRAQADDGSVLRRADRSKVLGIGIPSGIVVVMTSDGDSKVLIGCGGGICSEDPVDGGTIIPIYWMQW